MSARADATSGIIHLNPPPRPDTPEGNVVVPIIPLGFWGSLTESIISTFNAFFVDGDRPWKQGKYQIALTSLLNPSKLDESLLSFAGERHILRILDILKNPNAPGSYRESYRYFVDRLREAIAATDFSSQSPAAELLGELCFQRFTHVHMYTFCETLVSTMIAQGRVNSRETGLNVLDGMVRAIPLSEQFALIKRAPQDWKAPIVDLKIEQARGALNLSFDAQRRNNVPYALFDILREDKLTVHIIRTGSPTIQRNEYSNWSYQGEATITPDFELFINVLKQRDLTLLFTSL